MPRLASGSLLSDTAQFGGGSNALAGFRPQTSFAGSLASAGKGTGFSALGSAGGGGGGSPFAGQIGQAVSQTATNAGGQGTSNAVQNTLSQFGIGKQMLGPLALGAGTALFGQVAGPKRPEIPELGQLPGVQRFGQESLSQLSGLTSRFQNLPNQALPEALASPIRRNFELQRRQFTSQFKAFRPGADLATDTEYARGMNEISQREAEATAQSQLSFQGEQRQNLLGELGVDQQQAQVLQQLAQLDIDTIMARTGLAAADAAQFKEVFGNLGGAIAGAGIMNSFRTP